MRSLLADVPDKIREFKIGHRLPKSVKVEVDPCSKRLHSPIHDGLGKIKGHVADRAGHEAIGAFSAVSQWAGICDLHLDCYNCVFKSLVSHLLLQMSPFY